MRSVKPFNEEGFKYLATVLPGTSKKTGKMLVECPRCHSSMIVLANSYYRNRIKCRCEVYHKRLYSIYTNMKTRCYNKNVPSYKNYGGRGIAICEEWLRDFRAFHDWALSNGYTDNLTIDRINVNDNYCPKNCRWVTKEEQQRNKTNTIIFNGTSLRDWCLKNGINYKLLHAYKTKHRDKSIEEIINLFVLKEGAGTDGEQQANTSDAGA